MFKIPWVRLKTNYIKKNIIVLQYFCADPADVFLRLCFLIPAAIIKIKKLTIYIF